MSVRLVSIIDAAGVSVTADERSLLRRRAIPLSQWADILGEVRGPVAHLLALLDAGHAVASDEGLALSHEVASLLPQAVADAIGLPPIAPMSVTLSFEGRIEEPGSSIRVRWHDAQMRVIRPLRRGVVVECAGEAGRLSRPLFDLAEAIDAFNATNGQAPEARITAWRPVQASLARTTGERVKADGYLSSLTIYQAGSFALDVRETSSGPDFLPVLMSRSKAASLEDTAPVSRGFDDGNAGSDADARDERADALLPPELQHGFEQKHFSGAARTSDAYVLARNTYLVVDPDLKAALDVVRMKRASSSEERRAFIRNPRPAIYEALNQPADTALEGGLFVETVQYSERVLGLGLWEPPKLPWLTRRAGQWLPERFPISVGSRTVNVTPDDIDVLSKVVDDAKREGASHIDVQGQSHPVGDVAAAISPYLAIVPGADDAERGVEEGSPHPAQAPDKHVLQIKTNIEGVEHQLAHPRRPVRIPAALPQASLALDAVPKPHQRTGFDWLVEAWSAGWPGVLLADDMGLGKTFQALAFLAWLRMNQRAPGTGAHPARGPILIVAPTALLRNWTAEAERHLALGALGDCVEAFGSGLSRLKRAKAANWSPEDALDIARLRDADWILTTYETLADNHRAFARVGFSIVLFDEMQKIKSPGTINTHAAKAMNADFVLGLTGTPIENRIADLWCIMDRVAPGYLGDLKSFSAVHRDESADALSALKSRLDEPLGDAPAIMLRRMKENILEGLPRKSIEKYRVSMPPLQAEAYLQALTNARAGARDQGAMLKAIHAFRSVSLHPEGGLGVDPFERKSIEAWVAGSARLMKTVEILKSIQRNREKVIVFVEDRAMQAAFASAALLLFDLRSAPAIINGEVAGPKRQPIVDRFQSGPAGFDLMVLSPKAAGVGLTITAANHVIHLSRWWNPAVEDQCNDRVYRIGQDRPVTIHVPIAVHPDFQEASFDETLDNLLENKRALSRHMLAPPVQENDVGVLFKAAVGALAR